MENINRASYKEREEGEGGTKEMEKDIGKIFANFGLNPTPQSPMLKKSGVLVECHYSTNF
jgi:hypothetical protein